ncbi:MAG: hypothetical protein ACREPX_05095, partial [Rhodanobacteraceae bacterium]
MKPALTIVMLCALLAFGSALAATKSKDVVKADTREAFAPIAASVIAEMGPEGRYAYIKPDE